jgi:hypothetical protein
MRPILPALMLLVLLAACVPAASNTMPRTSLEIPGGPTLDVAATRLSNAPTALENAFRLFYTASPDRLGPSVTVALAEPNALEAAFLRQGTTVQSRWTYADTQLFTWPLGASQRIIAVMQGGQAIVRVHRSDINPPFFGRVIAKRLAERSTPKYHVGAADIARKLDYMLGSPRAPGFEYSLRRPTSNPNVFDQFDFRVSSLEARFVVSERVTLPEEVDAAIRPSFAGNQVRLITAPIRINGEPHFGLEVPVLIGNCSLEALDDREASYVCSRNGQDRNISVAVRTGQ